MGMRLFYVFALMWPGLPLPPCLPRGGLVRPSAEMAGAHGPYQPWGAWEASEFTPTLPPLTELGAIRHGIRVPGCVQLLVWSGVAALWVWVGRRPGARVEERASRAWLQC